MNKAVTVNVSYAFPIFMVLLILKLAGVVTWSWWLITLPLWLPFACVIVAGFFAFVIAVIVAALQ